MNLPQSSTAPESVLTDAAATEEPGAKRPVGIWLGLLIFCIPVIGAWFTLRKGYSRTARTIAFAWMLVYIAGNMKDADDKGPVAAEAGAVSASSSFSFSGVKQFSCRDDGVDPQTWEDGKLYFNFLENGQVLMNMTASGATFSGQWSLSGDRMSMVFAGAAAASGEVVAFKKASRKTFEGADVKGKAGDGSTLIRTKGFGLDCLVA